MACILYQGRTQNGLQRTSRRQIDVFQAASSIDRLHHGDRDTRRSQLIDKSGKNSEHHVLAREAATFSISAWYLRST